MNNKKTDWIKYIVVFLITGLLFITATYLSNHFTEKKIDQIKSIQDKIAIDLLSSETQFALFEETSCRDASSQSVLSTELNTLADRIAYSERNINISKDELLALKRYYSLLEVKDYLLMKKLNERCNLKSEFILHFYDNEDCEPCVREWYVLGELREKYPQLRIYSFDYNLDLSTIKTLISIYKIPDQMPSLVMNDKVYAGFQSVEDIEKAFPELLKQLEKNAADAAKEVVILKTKKD